MGAFEDLSALHDGATQAFGQQDQKHVLRVPFASACPFRIGECNSVVAHCYWPRQFWPSGKQLLERYIAPSKKRRHDDSTALIHQAGHGYADAINPLWIDSGGGQKASGELGDLRHGLLHITQMRAHRRVDSMHNPHSQIDQHACQRNAGYVDADGVRPFGIEA
ncbi:MAG: hypothetical protein WDN30_02790 [Pararobbsia sp.]